MRAESRVAITGARSMLTKSQCLAGAGLAVSSRDSGSAAVLFARDFALTRSVCTSINERLKLSSKDMRERGRAGESEALRREGRRPNDGPNFIPANTLDRALLILFR